VQTHDFEIFITKMDQKKPNIYHILFDGFHSLVFLNALKTLNTINDFNGFTFFKKNRANYDDTFASFPSLWSGRFYKKGPFKHWIDIQKNPGIHSQLKRYGYELNQYTDNTDFTFNNTSLLKLNIDQINHYKPATSHAAKVLKSYNHFVKHLLSERIGKGTQLAFSKTIKPFNIQLKSKNGYPSFSVDRFLLSDFVLSLPLMLNFVKHEEKKPASGQYNFAHIMLPHSPFNWTRSFTSSDSSYIEQVYCSINLMILLINELKRLDRFNNSLIIFHADHGMSDVEFQYPFMDEVSEKIIKKIGSTINHPASRFLHRSHALLLIKPPGSDCIQPLEISDRITQLADIPPTIFDLLKWDSPTMYGSPIFSDNWDFTREIHLFSGLHRYNKLGLKCDFGKHFLRGHLAHFSLNTKNEWKIYPDLPISWN